jgi:hypothetical protein
MGMSGGDVGLSPSSTREIIKVLSSAEKYFSTSLELASDRGEVTHVRDAAISLSIIRTFQSSLGKNSKNGPTVVAALLSMSFLGYGSHMALTDPSSVFRYRTYSHFGQGNDRMRGPKILGHCNLRGSGLASDELNGDARGPQSGT